MEKEEGEEKKDGEATPVKDQKVAVTRVRIEGRWVTRGEKSHHSHSQQRHFHHVHRRCGWETQIEEIICDAAMWKQVNGEDLHHLRHLHCFEEKYAAN